MTFLRRLFGARPLDALFGARAVDPAVLLERIASHPALAEPWPRRPELDSDAYLALTFAEHDALSKEALRARSGLPPIEDLVADLRALAPDPSCVALLAKIWQRHPLNALRAPAAAGLLALGTSSGEARRALMVMETDWDPLSVRVVADALIFDPAGLDALAYRIQRARRGDRAAMRLLRGVLRVASVPRDGMEAALSAVVHARPFLTLAAELLTLDEVAEDARDFLRAAPREVVRELIVGKRATPQTPRSTWGAGYRTPTERHLVAEPWDTYAALGPIDGALREEALRAATDLMRRVARNADVVHQRLRSAGWPVPWFGRMPPDRKATYREAFADHVGPDREAAHPDLDAHLAALTEAIGGPVPVALEAFWREVGGISWVSAEEDVLPSWLTRVGLGAEMGGVELLSLPECFDGVADWQRDVATDGIELAGPLSLSLRFGTESTLAPAAIVLPSYEADPWVVGTGMRLVPYLRHVFAWGGLVGLAHLDRSVSDHAEIAAVLRELTRDLEPF